MDTVFALRGEGFVLVVSDTGLAQSITQLAPDQRKTFELDDALLLALAGEQADRCLLGPMIERTARLLRMRHGRPLSTAEAAQLLRTRVAERLRQGALQVGGIVAGGDGRLFWADALGAVVEVPHGAHGYASYFVTSVLGDGWRAGMDEVEALALARRCVAELQTRLLLHQPHFRFEVVDAKGIRRVE